MSLLISKVNGIKVIQVGDSKLSIQNKSEDGGKVGGGIGAEDGINKTIDLGKGKRKHKLRIYTFDKNENDALFKIFYGERFCTIVDKFRGKIRVYIDSIEITDSDKHVNRTVYDISCTVQDDEWTIRINFAVKLTSLVVDMESEVGDMVTQLARIASSVDTHIEPLTGMLGFVDSALDMTLKGANSMLDASNTSISAYLFENFKSDTSQRLVESLISIKNSTDELTALLIGLTESNSDTQTTTLQSVAKSEIIEVVVPTLDGVAFSDIDISTVSQFDIEEMEKETVASNLVNKVKAIRDIKSILEGGFNSRNDFEATVDAVVERVGYAGYSSEEISDKVYLVKSFANEQDYRDIIEIDVIKKKPLVALVYELYGNLDNLGNIEAMNARVDNDMVYGKVKVFS